MKAFAQAMIGTAGWSLPANNFAFPSDGSHLERYAAVFSSVEINSSFYRSHRPATYARWRDRVPEIFRFSVNFPRSVSHVNRLHDVDSLLEQFLSETGELKERLGCLLLQLPPSLIFSPSVVGAFFSVLRGMTSVPVACEPRHASWFSVEAEALMYLHAVSFVDADPSLVAGVSRTGDPSTMYIRLHGSPQRYRSAYAPEFLGALAGRIAAASSRTTQIWCMFDNTAAGAAIPDALLLKQYLAN